MTDLKANGEGSLTINLNIFKQNDFIHIFYLDIFWMLVKDYKSSYLIFLRIF